MSWSCGLVDVLLTDKVLARVKHKNQVLKTGGRHLAERKEHVRCLPFQKITLFDRSRPSMGTAEQGRFWETQARAPIRCLPKC